LLALDLGAGEYGADQVRALLVDRQRVLESGSDEVTEGQGVGGGDRLQRSLHLGPQGEDVGGLEGLASNLAEVDLLENGVRRRVDPSVHRQPGLGSAKTAAPRDP